jgi:EAL domain-containing protein (putative c-di-GMP-specific phosphodiesterase class I)
VKSHGISPEKVTLEVTETAATSNPSSMLTSLTTLHDQGFQISADDFGIGYSSLQELNRMPFTEIKIDRSFVAGISNSAKSAAILESIVSLADKLSMRTVAEGIETQEELHFVQSIGCGIGQGFLLGEPMGYAELREYEQSHHATDVVLA